MTKKELIALAESQNIRFKKSWKKEQILEAIELGITNDDPIWLECKFTKLKFDAIAFGVTERTEVHPEVANWKQAAHKHNWYSEFFEAIDYGVEQGFETLDQFEEVFERAQADKPLDGSEPEQIPYNLELAGTGYKYFQYTGKSRKPWIAKITGLSSKYGFEREFQEPVEKLEDSRGRLRFNITENGYYQRKEYSGSGSEYVAWYHFKDNKLTEIEEKDIKQVFGDPQELLAKAKSDNLAQRLNATRFFNPNWSGGIGKTIKVDEKFYKIVDFEEERVDIDGIPCSHPDNSGYFATDTTYYCVLATEEEIESYNLKISSEKELKEAVELIRKIEQTFDWTEPKKVYPKGIRVSYRFARLSYDSPSLYFDFENNKIWRSIYNGRDGDLWSLNNYQGCYIVTAANFTGEKQKVLEALKTIQKYKPEALEDI